MRHFEDKLMQREYVFWKDAHAYGHKKLRSPESTPFWFGYDGYDSLYRPNTPSYAAFLAGQDCRRIDDMQDNADQEVYHEPENEDDS